MARLVVPRVVVVGATLQPGERSYDHLRADSARTVPPLLDPEKLAALLYTSGTSGRPRAAMLTHRAFLHEYVSCLVALDLREDDDPLHVMPLYHSAGMHVFTLPYLAVGATIRMMEAPDVPEVLRVGIAWSAAAVRQTVAGVIDRTDVVALLDDVEVTDLS